MTGYDLILELLSNRGRKNSAVSEVIQEFIRYGGVDTESLTEDMVLAGLKRDSRADWRKLFFSACETLAYPCANPDEPISQTTALALVIAIVLASAGIPTGIETDFELAKICRTLSLLDDELYEDIELVFCFVADELRNEDHISL